MSVKIFADPSIIGTSSPSISIIALSIPAIYKAASKCSTVETFTPCLFSSVVHNLAEVTFEKFALTKLFFKSTLLKVIPVLLLQDI